MQNFLHPTQIAVLKSMSMRETSRYTDLKPPEMDPQEFTYHIKQLLNKGFIHQDSESKIYTLTEKGKLRLALGIDVQSWGNTPLHSGVMLYVRRNGKILCVKRDKAPFLNYTGLLYYPTEKDFFLEEIAQKALTDLNLKGKLDLRVIIEVMFHNDNHEIIRHACMFTYLVDDPKGEVIGKSYEGDLLWLTPKELLKAKPGYNNTKDVVDALEGENDQQGIKLISKRYNTPL